MQTIELDSLVVPAWALALLMSLCSLALCLVIKRFAFKQFRRAIDRTSFYYDSLLISSLEKPASLVVLVLNLVLLEYLLDLFQVAGVPVAKLNTFATPALLILAGGLFIDRCVSGLITRYADHSEVLKSSQSIARGVSRAIIVGIGALVLLSTLGISVTPIIASLGIGSLAVALALQPTLENFFSGVQLVVDKPIRVGDFIELESGEQGFVERIGWRSTWIKTLPNNTVIMPNSVMSKTRIINYFYPSKELSVPVEVGVHYSSDLEHVERVTVEVAREILQTHPYGVETYDTFILYHTFDSSSINFTVMLRAHEYFHRFFIKSAFIKALHKRYAEEGIVIPYPIRALNTSQERPEFLHTAIDSDAGN